MRLIKNNSLHKEKVYERSPSYKIYESLDQVNSKGTAVEGGVIRWIMLMNDDNFYVCIDREKWENGIILYKLSLIIRKEEI